MRSLSLRSARASINSDSVRRTVALRDSRVARVSLCSRTARTCPFLTFIPSSTSIFSTRPGTLAPIIAWCRDLMYPLAERSLSFSPSVMRWTRATLTSGFGRIFSYCRTPKTVAAATNPAGISQRAAPSQPPPVPAGSLARPKLTPEFRRTPGRFPPLDPQRSQVVPQRTGHAKAPASLGDCPSPPITAVSTTSFGKHCNPGSPDRPAESPFTRLPSKASLQTTIDPPPSTFGNLRPSSREFA